MDSNFIRKRITDLRIKKGVSEYKMSTDLGHSKSYIQSISSGKSLPSFAEFFYICEYLGITPKDFFDIDNEEPILINHLIKKSKELSCDDLKMLISIAEKFTIK